MPRRLAPDSWLSHLCAYFGLRAYDLAQYLGMDAGQLSRLATGQRPTGPVVQEALAPFVASAHGLADPGAGPLALAPPAAAALEARLDYCRHHARRLRRALRPLEAQAQAAARWSAALPALRAALPPDPGAEPAAADWPAWHTWFRHRWLDRHPAALSPDQSAAYHLLRLRVEALETEAAALLALLPPAAGSQG